MNAFTRQEISAITPETIHPAWIKSSPKAAFRTYQPVVDITSRRVVAYQAKSPLIRTGENQLSKLIKQSPPGRPLLITLDLQEFMDEQGSSDDMVSVLQQYLWSEFDVIVHLDGSPNDSELMQFYEQLQWAGVPTMVDATADWNPSSINILLDANIIRFTLPYFPETLLEMTQQLGIQTLLAEIDGVQIHNAKRLGFEWIQVAL
ncbi:MAG TPA: hypothetical protein VEA39_01945 [Methylophilaceae bacterium]|nr:hypothetical protein [Methylophilaceae bacterium]